MICDSGKVSLEHLLLSRYPSQRSPASVCSVEPSKPESIIRGNVATFQHISKKRIPGSNVLPVTFWVAGFPRKVDVRLPGKENSNSHGARPVYVIITILKCFRNRRLSLNNSLFFVAQPPRILSVDSERHPYPLLMSCFTELIALATKFGVK